MFEKPPSTGKYFVIEFGDSPSFFGSRVNIGFETPPYYRELRYPRFRGRPPFSGSVLISGSRRLPSTGNCVSLEFGGPSLWGGRSNPGFETSP